MTLNLRGRAPAHTWLAALMAVTLFGAACASNDKAAAPGGGPNQVSTGSPLPGASEPAPGNTAVTEAPATGAPDANSAPAPNSPAPAPSGGQIPTGVATPTTARGGSSVPNAPASKQGASNSPKGPSAQQSPSPVPGGGAAPAPAPAPGAGAGSAAGNRTGVTDTTIKIGCAYVQSGPVGPAARAWKQGALAYYKYINDQGGINGRKLEFIGADTGFDPAKGLAATKKLVEVDKVFTLCDPDYPTEFLVVPYIEEQQVPGAVLGMTGEIVKGSKWLFSGAPSNQNMAGIPLRWAAESQKVKTVGVIYLDNDWGKKGLAYAEKVAAKYGMKITEKRSIDSDAQGIESVVLAMRAANPDFILQISDPVPCLKAWAAAQQQQYKPPKGWVGTACYLDSFAGFLGDWGTGFMGLANVEGPYAAASNPAVDNAMKTIKKYFPDWDPFVYGLADWHIATIQVEAIKRAGRDLTREKLRDAWEGLRNFSTGLNPPNQPVNYGPGNHVAHDSQRIVRINDKHQWEPITDWIQDPHV